MPIASVGWTFLAMVTEVIERKMSVPDELRLPETTRQLMVNAARRIPPSPPKWGSDPDFVISPKAA